MSKPETVIPFNHTAYGFQWGAAKVERFHSEQKTGAVTLGITTPKGQVCVYVTRTGKVRVYDRKCGEWAPKA